MYASYLFPFYRSPLFPGYGYSYSYPNYGYFSNNISNIVGSAVANQTMTTIGAGAIGGIQTATPTVIW